VLGILTAILPEGNVLPANFSELITDLFVMVWGWDWLIPISTLITVLNLAVWWVVIEWGVKRAFAVMSWIKVKM